MAVDHRLLHRMQAAARRDASTVVTLASSIGRNRMQALTARRRSPARDRTTTVQAPQSPSAQPSLVPVSRRTRRSHSSSVVGGGTPATSTGSPFCKNEAYRHRFSADLFWKLICLPYRLLLSSPATAKKKKNKKHREITAPNIGIEVSLAGQLTVF